MRVVFLTHYFVPEVGAAQARIAALARGLQTHGVDVVVHTGFPHYPAGQVLPPYRNALVARERLDGVPVVRSLTYPVPNAGFVRRVANHAVLASSTLLTARASGPADVVVAETPPLFMAASGVLHARAKRAALALNVSDRWPASAVELGALTSPRAIATAEALERWCYRHAAAITAPTRGIVDALSELPEARGRVHHVPPAVDLERWRGLPAVDPSAERPLRVLYAGTLGMAQGVETLVDAAVLAGPDAVELTLLGDGPDRATAAQRAASGAPHVSVPGAVAAADVPARYATADVAAIPLRDVPLFRGALPTKLFEALAAGRPVVLAAPEGEATALIRDAGCGVTVPPEDPRALADALTALQRDPERVARMADAARRAATAYDRGRAVARWLELLRSLADGRRSWPAAGARRPSG